MEFYNLGELIVLDYTKALEKDNITAAFDHRN